MDAFLTLLPKEGLYFVPVHAEKNTITNFQREIYMFPLKFRRKRGVIGAFISVLPYTPTFILSLLIYQLIHCVAEVHI